MTRCVVEVDSGWIAPKFTCAEAWRMREGATPLPLTARFLVRAPPLKAIVTVPL